MALQTLNPHRHTVAVSPALSPVPRCRHPPPQPLLHLPPPRRLAGGAARPRAVAAAVSGAVNEARRRGAPQEGDREDGRRKDTDLATLGNLCVDVVLSVPPLPPAPREERKAYMERLAASPPDQLGGESRAAWGLGRRAAAALLPQGAADVDAASTAASSMPGPGRMAAASPTLVFLRDEETALPIDDASRVRRMESRPRRQRTGRPKAAPMQRRRPW